MTMEWQDVVAVVALSGYGLTQLRTVLLGRASKWSKIAHTTVHLGAAVTGALLTPSPAVGLALGLAGAGAIRFVDQFVRARVGGRAPVDGAVDTEAHDG